MHALFAMRHVNVAFLLFAILLPMAAGASEPREPRPVEVDQLFADCDRSDIPGCAVAIVRKGETIYAKGFGTANLAYEVPNSPTTVFEIGSVSKAFTSVCIALLLDEGKLSADDDLRELLPEMKRLEQPVRVRDMLRCESGIWEHIHVMPLAGRDNEPVQTAYSKADVLTVLSGQRRLPFQPGTQFQYGSGDFFLLGIVVERITGQTIAQFAKARLFDPLGMTRTYYQEDPSLVVKNKAVGHWKSKFGWTTGGPELQNQWRSWQMNAHLGAGGGLCTCVEDLARWNEAFDKDVLPKGRYMHEFLRDGTVLDNRFVLDVDAYLKRTSPHPDNEPMGQYCGLRRIQFTGGLWGFESCFARFPDHELTVICLSNSDDVSPFSKTRQIAELFLGDKMKASSCSGTSAAGKSIELTNEQLQPLIGDYRQQGNSPLVHVDIRDGDLAVVDQLGNVTPLKAVATNCFRAASSKSETAGARYDFQRDGRGLVIGFNCSSCAQGLHRTDQFHRVVLSQPTAIALAEYSGTYDSDELAATYIFKVDDDGLWVRVNGRRWERLRPLASDEFVPWLAAPHDQRFFRFLRNADHRVHALSVGLFRIRDLRFARRERQ